MQVLLPFTKSEDEDIKIIKNLEIKMGLDISKENNSVQFNSESYKIDVFKEEFILKDNETNKDNSIVNKYIHINTSTPKQDNIHMQTNFNHLVKQSKFEFKPVSANNRNISLSVIERGAIFIKAVSGVFDIKNIFIEPVFKVSKSECSPYISINKINEKIDINSNLYKINNSFSPNVAVVHMTQVSQEFPCYNKTNTELSVFENNGKEKGKAVFNVDINKKELSIVSEIKNKVGYLVTDEKTSVIQLVKGYNLIHIPVYLRKKGIFKAYDFVKRVANYLGKQTYEVFTEINKISGNKKTMFVLNKNYITNPDSSNNFDLFEITSESFTGISIEVFCLDNIEINLKKL